MAAMSTVVRNTVLNLSKPSHKCHSVSFSLRPKISRVYFASASRHPDQGRNAAAGGKTNPYDADEAVSEPRDDVKVTMDRAKEKTREMKEKAKGHAEAMKDKTNDAAGIAKERANEMRDKTQENLGSMGDTANEMRDEAADSAGKMKEKTKDAAESVADKTKEYAHGAKESTKGVAEKMADTAGNLGEQAKQKVQKIKETVMGKWDEDDVGELDDYMKDYERKVERDCKEKEEKVMDEDVVDLRRQAGEEHGQSK